MQLSMPPGLVTHFLEGLPMTTTLSAITATAEPDIFYPSEDGKPLAETSVHFDAIVDIVTTLRLYLGDTGILLSNQFFYYSQGYPKLRIAPDVMVIFDVPPGPRDNYKLWVEDQIPQAVFEITSPSTQDQDLIFKKTLYEQLGITEYWLFDPKGEWIPNQLQGYQLLGEVYHPITDAHSSVLKLHLEVQAQSVLFYRDDTGEKLLNTAELDQARQEALTAKLEAEQRAHQAEQELAHLRAQLQAQGITLEGS